VCVCVCVCVCVYIYIYIYIYICVCVCVYLPNAHREQKRRNPKSLQLMKSATIIVEGCGANEAGDCGGRGGRIWWTADEQGHLKEHSHAEQHMTPPTRAPLPASAQAASGWLRADSAHFAAHRALDVDTDYDTR